MDQGLHRCNVLECGRPGEGVLTVEDDGHQEFTVCSDHGYLLAAGAVASLQPGAMAARINFGSTVSPLPAQRSYRRDGHL